MGLNVIDVSRNTLIFNASVTAPVIDASSYLYTTNSLL